MTPAGLIELPEDEARAAAARFDLARLEPSFLDNPFRLSRAASLRAGEAVGRWQRLHLALCDAALCYRTRRCSTSAGVRRQVRRSTPLYRHHTTSLVFNNARCIRAWPAAGRRFTRAR